MYAIFKAKGKQFRAEPDATVRIPSLDAEPGEKVTFDEVLLGGKDGGDVVVGRPALQGATVEAEVVRHGKDDKVVVYKMKRRKGYRRKQGHRQKFTEVRILAIDLGSAPPGPAKRAKRPEPEPQVEEPAAEAPAPEPETAPEPEAVEEPEEAAEPAAAVDVDITDAARKLAEEHGLDLSTVEGTGVDGRILKGDVQKAIQAREAEE